MPSTPQRYDYAIVGSGVLGLGHAWAAQRRGARIAVCEADPRPQGASVRNFGMIWPIGQPIGSDTHALALRGRDLWLELSALAHFPVHRCGSLHLAHRADEWEVLEEFAAEQGAGYVSLCTPAEVARQSPAANPDGLRGGLWSESELRLNPRIAIARAAEYLGGLREVDLFLDSHVTQVDDAGVQTADGTQLAADRVVVCSGSKFGSLLPDVARTHQLRACKLQMLRTVSQPAGWQLGPHLAGGLTLRHYAVFAGCRSLPALKQRIAEESPELDQFGIHVMASQTDEGELILGDSHHYGEAIEPFDQEQVDQLILRELRRIARFPRWEIQQRWHGIYAQHPTQPFLDVAVTPRLRVVNGIGGAGMTMGLAVGESVIADWNTTPATPAN